MKKIEIEITVENTNDNKTIHMPLGIEQMELKKKLQEFIVINNKSVRAWNEIFGESSHFQTPLKYLKIIAWHLPYPNMPLDRSMDIIELNKWVLTLELDALKDEEIDLIDVYMKKNPTKPLEVALYRLRKFGDTGFHYEERH